MECTASIGCDRTKFSSSANYLACIRSLSTSTVMSGVGNASAPGYPPLAPVMPWGPTIDGSSSGLMRLPLDSMQANVWNRVPLLLGTNKDEATILLPAIAMIVKGIHWPLQDQDLVPTLSHFFEKSIVDKILTMYPKTSTSYFSNQNFLNFRLTCLNLDRQQHGQLTCGRSASRLLLRVSVASCRSRGDRQRTAGLSVSVRLPGRLD
jgi:carboxylesterase type B